MKSKTKKQSRFEADKFLYKLGQEHERKKILDLIDKRINNFKELIEKFPKNQTFVDMWTSLFELKQSIEEFDYAKDKYAFLNNPKYIAKTKDINGCGKVCKFPNGAIETCGILGWLCSECKEEETGDGYMEHGIEPQEPNLDEVEDES